MSYKVQISLFALFAFFVCLLAFTIVDLDPLLSITCALFLTLIMMVAVHFFIQKVTAAEMNFIVNDIARLLNTHEYKKTHNSSSIYYPVYVQTMQDLSLEYKRIDQEISALKNVLRGMKEGVVTLDSSGRALKWNRAAQEITGIREEWRGRPIGEIMRSTVFDELIQQVLRERTIIQREITLTGYTRRVLEVDAIPLASTSSEQSILLVLHDLSRVKRLEEVRTDFIANVSHELRTPITAIRGFAETLLGGALESPVMSKRFIEIIFKQSKRLESIIDELLLLSSLEHTPGASLNFESTKVEEIINSSIEVVSHKIEEKKITIEISGARDLTISVRIPLIEQALLNLLQNAIAYSPMSGRVQIHIDNDVETVSIHISDQGPGIAEVHQSRLFERFYRVDKARSRKEGGTGLGLAIVKHITQVHGGSIQVRSTLGQGSTFTMKLPKTQVTPHHINHK